MLRNHSTPVVLVLAGCDDSAVRYSRIDGDCYSSKRIPVSQQSSLIAPSWLTHKTRRLHWYLSHLVGYYSNEVAITKLTLTSTRSHSASNLRRWNGKSSPNVSPKINRMVCRAEGAYLGTGRGERWLRSASVSGRWNTDAAGRLLALWVLFADRSLTSVQFYNAMVALSGETI